ncbi:MAG: hypothetical protein V1908_02405 [Candidatus Peregrinibacteria bacterium]
MEHALQPTTVNKLGGEAMSQLDQVKCMIDTRKQRGERIVLVVSAFKGVTDTLMTAMDNLDGQDYQERSIDGAFHPTRGLHETIFERYFTGEHKDRANTTYQQEYEKLRTALIAHKAITNVLRSEARTFKIRDQVIGFGEKIAGMLLKIYLEQEGNQSHFYDEVNARGYPANGNTLSVRRLHEAIRAGIEESIRAVGEIRAEVIQIFGGHVGNTPHGISEDIGRSYTDTTAVDVALVLKEMGFNLQATRFWKGVEGVLTANPNVLGSNNKPVRHRHISLAEGAEIASAEGGSGLMQISALALAERHKLDLEFRDFREPANEGAGTIYTTGGIETRHAFKNITGNRNIDTLTIRVIEMADQQGFIDSIGNALKREGIIIDCIFCSGSELTFSLLLPRDRSLRRAYREKIERVRTELSQGVIVDEERYPVDTLDWDQEAYACVSVVGSELKGKRGILMTLAGALSFRGADIHGITLSKSQLRISFLVRENLCDDVVRALHSIFVDQDAQVIADYRDYMERVLESLTSTYQ